jgi:hypothetical protein
MKIIIFLLFVANLQAQAVINLGPFKSNFSDPIAKSQEKRATSVDQQMVPKVTVMAVETQIVRKFVVDYENSLRTISPQLKGIETDTKYFLDKCISYIVAKHSIVGNIPGLSRLVIKLRLIATFKTNKIRVLKTELVNIYKTDNYMTEGERKILVLDIVDRALQITL